MKLWIILIVILTNPLFEYFVWFLVNKFRKIHPYEIMDYINGHLDQSIVRVFRVVRG
jgi:hypothetical protein